MNAGLMRQVIDQPHDHGVPHGKAERGAWDRSVVRLSMHISRAGDDRTSGSGHEVVRVISNTPDPGVPVKCLRLELHKDLTVST